MSWLSRAISASVVCRGAVVVVVVAVETSGLLKLVVSTIFRVITGGEEEGESSESCERSGERCLGAIGPRFVRDGIGDEMSFVVRKMLWSILAKEESFSLPFFKIMRFYE